MKHDPDFDSNDDSENCSDEDSGENAWEKLQVWMELNRKELRMCDLNEEDFLDLARQAGIDTMDLGVLKELLVGWDSEKKKSTEKNKN